jgi:hypothetical protein
MLRGSRCSVRDQVGGEQRPVRRVHPRARRRPNERTAQQRAQIRQQRLHFRRVQHGRLDEK